MATVRLINMLDEEWERLVRILERFEFIKF